MWGRKRRLKQIAPADKVTFASMTNEQLHKVNSFFQHPGAAIYYAFLASEQDLLVVESQRLLLDGKDREAIAKAAKAEQVGDFATHSHTVARMVANTLDKKKLDKSDEDE